jgi:hypothetical protein
MSQYPNSGKLSKNGYKQNPKQPDMTGQLMMDKSTLKALMEEQDGDEVLIKLSAWNMTGQFGEWLRLSWNNYKSDFKPQTQFAPPAKPAANDMIEDKDIPF